ncbi:MAG TPA: 4-hydroxy-tetrahydrodipicolinate synthase [Myxococcota bacterium]|nr:4-hydroxy-tetrahydrodipicolinate synthase [Myxococcota bacterium]
MFKGPLTALVTPFKDGALDIDSLRRLVERQIAGGISGLVACGTTGEAAAMSMEEKLLVIRQVSEQTAGRVPVIAGTGSNNTKATIEMTRKAAALKIDGVLVVTPYYVKPTQAGLIDHFARVAKVGPPVVAYNVPGRTGVSLTPASVAELARLENVVALKEASGDLKLDALMIRAQRESGGELAIFSGDDFTFLPLLALGGRGCISVVSNVAPGRMAEMYSKFESGDLEGARKIHFDLLPLTEALFLESNPIPVKAAMAMLGECGPEIRPPLAPLSEKHNPRLRGAMQALGLLEKPT